MLPSKYAKMLCRLAEHSVQRILTAKTQQHLTALFLMIASLSWKSNSIIFLQQKSCVRSISRLYAVHRLFQLNDRISLFIAGQNLPPGSYQKGLDFRLSPSYYTTAIRDRNRPAAWRSWAIVLYHINTTDRFGTHGNSGHKSDEKCRNLCKMH